MRQKTTSVERSITVVGGSVCTMLWSLGDYCWWVIPQGTAWPENQGGAPVDCLWLAEYHPKLFLAEIKKKNVLLVSFWLHTIWLYWPFLYSISFLFLQGILVHFTLKTWISDKCFISKEINAKVECTLLVKLINPPTSRCAFAWIFVISPRMSYKISRLACISWVSICKQCKL